MLDVVDEAQGLLARRAQRLDALLPGKLDDIDVIVVALRRPVDHVLAARQASVAEHVFGGHLPAAAHAAPLELRGVIPLGTGDRAVGTLAVVLEDGHDREVLHDVVGLVGCELLTRQRAGVHAHAVGRAAHRQRLAQVRGVDRRAGLDLEAVSPLVEEAGARHRALLHADRFEAVAVDHLKGGLRGGHRPEDAVGDVGFKQRGAHPPRRQGAGASVVAAQRLAELVPEARGELVVAVDGRDALCREHAAEHGRGFDDEGADTLAGRGDGGRRSGGRAADDQHVHRAAGRGAAGRKS